MKKTVLLNVLITISFFAVAQEKYAVLICGDAPSEEPVLVTEGATWGSPGDYSWNEFWNDTFLMWEMLVYEKDFDNENVYVLYYDGDDYYNINQDERYIVDDPYTEITDYKADRQKVMMVFDGLATGTNGFPLVTEDDFLFIWTFGHGGPGEIPPEVELVLYGGAISETEFAAKVNPINAIKKVFWMQHCKAGNFHDDLENNKTIIHSAGSVGENASVADDYWDMENENINSIIYQHGEFNFHMYSPTIGLTPYYDNSYGSEQLSITDLNNDNFISVYETYHWEQSHETTEETPLYSDLGSIGAYTSLKYPTLLHTDITTNQTHRGLIGVSKDIHITSGNTLTFYENAKVHLLNEARIIVDAGGTLTIGDNVTINGTHNNNHISVNGNITFGQNAGFEADENVLWKVYLNNTSLQTAINNVSFTQCELHNSGQSLTITNSTFNDCEGVYSLFGDITVSNNTNFSNTGLYLANQSAINYSATISGCTFTNNGSNNISAISIWNYDHYLITNNTISGYYDGLFISLSGIGTEMFQFISGNEIHNCSNSGVHIYNSLSTLSENYIYNNGSGIRLNNNTTVGIYGQSGANTYEEVNFITDNDSYEIYASTGSFPWYFRHNAIIDDDNLGNPTDPLFYYVPPGGGSPLLDVRYNCWFYDEENFSPSEDLYPSGYMVYPIWCPGDGGLKSSELALQTFLDGIAFFENEEYSDARSAFESVIELYPHTQYASTAMKELFTLEEFADNDYNTLKQYYETNDSIQADTVLTKLAVFLVNQCEIEIENWQIAIDHFEDIIENPESPEDSIFAVIDLGHTYFLMGDTNYRSIASGKMKEHIPTTLEAFAEKRDHLLSLLPVNKEQEELKNQLESLPEGMLLQNVPNPVSNTTTIYYKLNTQSSAMLKVYDYTGKEVYIADQLSDNIGLNKTELDVSNLPSGIYFYSLIIDGQLSDTKKMVLK